MKKKTERYFAADINGKNFKMNGHYNFLLKNKF